MPTYFQSHVYGKKFLFQSDDEYVGEGNLSPTSGLAQAMLDRSRLTLCMMMLAVLAFNPFGTLLSHAATSLQADGRPTTGFGRAILALATGDGIEATDGTGSSSWPVSLFVWILNLLVLTGVFMHALIHGEPTIERHSKEASLYWRQRKQADCDMNNVSIGVHYCYRWFSVYWEELLMIFYWWYFLLHHWFECPTIH